MKRLMLASAVAALAIASPALAEGLPNRSHEPAAAPAFSWTGLYLGLHAGASLDATSTFTYTVSGNFEPAGRPRPVDVDGIIGGIHGGYLYQLPNTGIVLGAEASVTTGRKGHLAENPPPVGNDYVTTSDLGPTYAATGRLGYAWDRFLVYGKAGWAWGTDDFSATFFNKDGPGGTNGSQVRIAHKFDLSGPVYGAGVEMALLKNVSLGLEWQRVDFGDSEVVTLKTTNSGILTEKLKSDHQVDSLLGRVNFRF